MKRHPWPIDRSITSCPPRSLVRENRPTKLGSCHPRTHQLRKLAMSFYHPASRKVTAVAVSVGGLTMKTWIFVQGRHKRQEFDLLGLGYLQSPLTGYTYRSPHNLGFGGKLSLKAPTGPAVVAAPPPRSTIHDPPLKRTPTIPAYPVFTRD